jgi:hypothetical protein
MFVEDRRTITPKHKPDSTNLGFAQHLSDNQLVAYYYNRQWSEWRIVPCDKPLPFGAAAAVWAAEAAARAEGAEGADGAAWAARAAVSLRRSADLTREHVPLRLVVEALARSVRNATREQESP